MSIPIARIEPRLWDINIDGKKVGHVIRSVLAAGECWSANVETSDRRSKSLGYDYLTQADAVAAIVAEHTKPLPKPCPECGQAVHA